MENTLKELTEDLQEAQRQRETKRQEVLMYDGIVQYLEQKIEKFPEKIEPKNKDKGKSKK